MRRKRGNILIENVIFIILNLAFLTILVLFLIKQGAGAALLEQSYAKQIALIIDSAPPNSVIELNMEKGKKVAEKNGVSFENIVRIDGNKVVVKLSPDSQSSYSFFRSGGLENIYTSELKYYVFVTPKREVIANA
ncbi:MAG: hypothetical protein KC516_00500 [Nanoarchaeota archaeon]|nr:hypothetical protein [Nanoarchaeota archaeon]